MAAGGDSILGGADVAATVAVRDLAKARPFYEEVLGLSVVQDDGGAGVVVFRAGAGRLVLYQSETGGQNPATSATWGLGAGFDAAVKALKAKDVAFEDYGDMPGMTHDGDIYRAGEFRAAWFKDPEGNILHINSGD